MKNVSLRGITKSFGQMNVLDRVDLDIEDGEFLVLVGPSVVVNLRFCAWSRGLSRFRAVI